MLVQSRVCGAKAASANVFPGSHPRNIRDTALPLPAGLPSSFNSPRSWTGSDYANDNSYILMLSQEDVKEIDEALAHVNASELPNGVDSISPATFPLPLLGPKLSGVGDELYNGRGFGLIRGLDINKYSVEDRSTIWLGIQSYIASLRARQDKAGNMMAHIVADNSSAIKATHYRHSTSSISFHNEDSGDIASWLTCNTAASGGRCIIASVETIFNVIAKTSPEMIRTLMKSDWPFALPYFRCRPVMYYHDNNLIMNFNRASLMGSASHPRSESLPSLNADQIAALDAIEAIAKATQFEVQTQPGDIHMINNLYLLHRRDSFVNGDEPSARRHLIRMRLRCEKRAPELPIELQDEWRPAFDGTGDRLWHLMPMPDGFYPLRAFSL
ncbi:Taurine catabolism dioxygenase TauD TfdA family protein [Ceratocystis lukuohia]|uniref:Taurine catabolism dioxygenase TauD TfdA family protein n=1 Tax=Ceratocystis lukuohia TaxID=2019550 RepID=A0ABR4M9A0_9PEZI